MKIITIPSQYLHKFKPAKPPQVRRSIGKAPADHKMTTGAYIPPIGERQAQAMTENQKRGKVRPISNRYYVRKKKTVPFVMPKLFEKFTKEKPVTTKVYISWINEAGRTVRKLAP